MVHARSSVAYINFTSMYTADHIFPALPIKNLINKDVDPATPFKLLTGKKPSVSHLRVLFCPCVAQKATAHVEKKALNMRHLAKKGFRGMFVGIPQHQKGYLIYVPITRKLISSYDVVFDGIFSIKLAYTSQPYVEVMFVPTAVSYTPFATSSREQTGVIIMFKYFEEGVLWSETQNLLAETRDNTESGNKYDDDSTIPPLISEE